MQTDRDKLIELKTQFVENFYCGDCTPKENKCKKCLTEKEADHLLANGVIVPPAEVGQTVYCVDDYLKIVEECKVYGFNVVNGKLSLLVDNGENKFITRKWHKTKEEAEAELEKRGKENAT